MSQHFFNKKLQRRIEEKTKNLEPWMYYGNFDLHKIQTKIKKELQEEGYANDDINCELEWFFDKENILKIIRTWFPPDIKLLGGCVYGVPELLCVIHGISTKFVQWILYLLYEKGTNLLFMKESIEAIERALDNGDLPYECTESKSWVNNIRIKLIDVVNWRKKKLSIYPDFCVPFDEKSEEMIIKEANIKTYDQLAKENNLLRNDIKLLKENVAELESWKSKVAAQIKNDESNECNSTKKESLKTINILYEIIGVLISNCCRVSLHSSIENFPCHLTSYVKRLLGDFKITHTYKCISSILMKAKEMVAENSLDLKDYFNQRVYTNSNVDKINKQITYYK